MPALLLYPIFPAVTLGLLSWLYYRKQGRVNTPQLFLGIMVFYALFYGLFKIFM
ncbi:MAG: hypothetical protein AB8B56_10450 [Crocinitomicaceae bacterium]